MSKFKHESFLTHPYLLCPTSDGMTIVWETSHPIDSEVIIEGNGHKYRLKPDVKQGTPWQHFENGTTYSSVRADNLDPGTEYKYWVALDNGTLFTSSFKTLPSNPEEVRFIFVSDSHSFDLGSQINARILEEKPDFIVHGGDFLVGSAFQKDQFQYWFQPMREALATIPSINIKGNHDEGPYFDDYFTSYQRQVYASDPMTGNNVAFEYGPVHFLFGNSNPWSLIEVNAEGAGLELDRYWRTVIDSSLTWIDETLASTSVQGKPWRICGFHHHYLDPATKKYLKPVLEKHNVELILQGHVHFYQHLLSESGKNHYVAIGDVISSGAAIEHNHPTKILMDDVPELLSLGQCDFVIVEANTEILKLKVHSVTSSEPISEHIWTKECDVVQASDIQISHSVCDAGHPIEIKAKITNTADFAQPAIIEAGLNGQDLNLNQFKHGDEKSVVMLNAQEYQTLTCDFVLTEPGVHILNISDQVYNIVIKPSPANFVFENSSVKVGTDLDSNLIKVTVDVINTGNLSGSVDVNLTVNNATVSTHTVELEGKQQESVKLKYRNTQGGLFQVGINDQWIDEVEILHGLTVLPQVIDMSGNGHNAILHGQPVLEETDGEISLVLDGKDDYVEIPPHPSLAPERAYATSVDAKINSLVGYNRFDHFALFSKGPSLGYGPTYLMRLAVRETGSLTTGISYNIDEYFWDGGHVKVNEFASYTASFDKTAGGHTWIDDTLVANIAGIGEQAVIRNWPDYPILVGMTYLGYIDKSIGRAKYYSLMRANLKRFRFFDSGVDLNHMQSKVCDSLPEQNLLIDLDFSNVSTAGTYSSPWIDDLGVYSATVELDLPKGAEAAMIIESEHGRQEQLLSNGVNVVSLDNKLKLKPISFILVLGGVMDVGETLIPTVKKLTLNGESGKRVFQTAADWSKGKMFGALGFESIHRLREYPDDGSI